MSDTAKKIAELNDKLRQEGIGGKTMATREFVALPQDVQLAAAKAIQAFSDFNSSNDPWNEHDCAIINLPEFKQAVKFKISYYNANEGDGYEWGSEAPEDASQTNRVIMFDTAHYITDEDE